AQLELIVDELEISVAQPTPVSRSAPTRKPIRKPLPQHLPRESVIYAPEATCPDCGTAMQRIGEDVSEMLEYVPARFKVIRHVRPKHIWCGRWWMRSGAMYWPLASCTRTTRRCRCCNRAAE